MPIAQIRTRPAARYRGGGDDAPRQFACQAMDLTWAWGSEPSSATLHYVSELSPVTSNSRVTITAAGHTFYGICKSDQAVAGSGGRVRELHFVDNREFLNADEVYCAFNKRDDKLVNGVRVRRYWHILPADFNGLRKTFTTTPYTAKQILDYIVGANKWSTVQDPWTCLYHVDQVNKPVFDIDALSGRRVKEVLQEISDKQGLIFTLMGGPFNLVWARKGEGGTPAFPADSDNRKIGTSLSDHPTRIRILGDRNIYQVANITMTPDWKTPWATNFYDLSLFTEYIYQHGATRHAQVIGDVTIPAGTAFTAIGDSVTDPEGVVARQLALAESLEITVGEFSSWGGNAGYRDTRKFAGRSRLEMPCAMYIRDILFRAFRLPDGFSITAANGQSIPAASLQVAHKMVAAVTHDPATGVMEFDIDAPPDGKGYAIVQGYQVGRDMFRSIRPDRFDINRWTDAQSVWEHIEFEIDASGEEDGCFILFQEPVIKSANLVQMVNGYAVFRADPTFVAPPVKACLTFEGDIFSYIGGAGNRDAVENVSGLGGEFALSHGGRPTEIPYLDGQTATQKAQDLATIRLQCQFYYTSGGYDRYPVPDEGGDYPDGTQLAGGIDRVSLKLGPDGITESVYFTSEAPRETFVPERDLERANQMRQLLPGQAQLREQANLARLTAAALRASPESLKTVTDAFRGVMGSPEPLHAVRIAK